MADTRATELAAARLWAAHAQPYLSTALFALSPVPRPGLGTFGVDRRWRLYYDPGQLEVWTTEEAGAVLVHEVHHLLRDHAGRAVTAGVAEGEAGRWNVAADLEINDDLTDLPLPKGGCFPQGFSLQDGQLAETYLQHLRLDAMPGWGDCGQGAHGSQTFPLAPEAPGVEPGEADLVRQQIAMEVRRRARSGESVAPGLERWAEEFLTPQVDWRRHLTAAVRTGIANVRGRVDYSYGRPHRRTAGDRGRRVIMPSLVQPVPDVAVVVDTSGSMGRVELGRALAEVDGVLAATGAVRVRVLSCDDAVHATQTVFDRAEVRLLGGGGTDMGAALEAAAALRPRPQVCVVVTDGFTPWPEHRPPFVVVVVIIGDVDEEHWSPPEWATTIRVRA